MNNQIKIGNILPVFIALSCAGSLYACTSISKNNVQPVEKFNIERYLGKWYEIGRFDFKWEKNMKNVQTIYSLNKDGSVKVVNSGYDYVKNKNKQSIGKAKFIGKQYDIANLKVSFFGPFYTPYTVIALDSEYKYALVSGGNKKLLWILSRTPTIPENIKEDYMQIAESAGFDLKNFIWTVQD